MKHSSMWSYCAALFAFACAILVFLSMSTRTVAQQSITSGFNYSQNFDSIGTSATATIPINWRIDKQGAVRTVGTWTAAVAATDFRAGNNMGSGVTNGIYNYAAGDPATAPDRALGWVSSSGGTASGNLYLYLRNDSPDSYLGSMQVAYDVEKYRTGTNAAGYRIQLYYSSDGSNWTNAGADFLTSFSADATTSGYATAPGAVASVNGTLTFASPILPNGDVYLAWNYSVPTGSTVTNAQALGIDNVQLSNPLRPSAVTLTNLSAVNRSITVPIIPLLGVFLAIALALLLRRRSRTA